MRESVYAHLQTLNRRYLSDLLNLQITEFVTQAVPNTLTSSTRALVFIAGDTG